MIKITPEDIKLLKDTTISVGEYNKIKERLDARLGEMHMFNTFSYGNYESIDFNLDLENNDLYLTGEHIPYVLYSVRFPISLLWNEDWKKEYLKQFSLLQKQEQDKRDKRYAEYVKLHDLIWNKLTEEERKLVNIAYAGYR